MRLVALLAALPEYRLVGSGDVDIAQIVTDSRRVTPGALFVAVRGVSVDGHRFIPDALARGAAAVVQESPEVPATPGVPRIIVPQAREALAYLCAAWHGFPARALRVIGVTGTDGKTTTCNLIYHILRAAGHRGGVISTANAVIGEQAYDTGFHTTTPDAPDVQRYLAEMVQTGTEYAVLESTSFGLAQGRVTACDFDVAVVTNITHEHLEQHQTYEAYVAAKARLFHFLTQGARKPGVAKVAVLNADDAHYGELRGIPADRTLTYGLRQRADLTATHIVTQPDGLAFDAQTPEGAFPVRSPLVGAYNVYNILAAVAVGLSQGIGVEAMRQGIAGLSGLPGRMERIDVGQDFTAIVDFAHTPYALEQALKAARSLVAPGGRVITLFGSAGLRDVQKRAMMGRVAAALADLTILTAEDPRTEPLDAILAEMARGCREGGGVEGLTFWQVADRSEAMAFAVRQAQAGDVVIACGKGHERSMCIGTTEFPWSDQEAMRDALRTLGAGHRKS